jgi:hypothetical protein
MQKAKLNILREMFLEYKYDIYNFEVKKEIPVQCSAN